MSDFYILGHLGLGDHIICNGLVRIYAQDHNSIKIPCYEHNYETVRFMFKDLPGIEAIPIKDQADAILMCHKKQCLKLGWYAGGSFNPTTFDQEFYLQASVPFQERWKSFKVDYQLIKEPIKGVIFLHEDQERGFSINRSHLNSSNLYMPTKSGKPKFFDHMWQIMHASEIHCINSSFLCLIDSLPDDKHQRLCFHHYARPTDYPTLKREWEIITA